MCSGHARMLRNMVANRRRRRDTTPRLFLLPAHIIGFLVLVLFLSGTITEGGAGWIPYAIAGMIVAARTLLSRVRADDAGVTVYNPIRRYQIAWSRIGHFTLEPVLPILRVGTVHLVDGGSVRMWGLVPDARAGAHDRATRYIDELNDLLTRHRPLHES